MVDDTTVEPLESLQINVANITTLTAPESAINRDTSTFTIINDDSATFTIADNNGVENAGAISVSVTLNQPVQDGLTVTFNSASGSAIDGSDYPTVSNVLFFDGNQGEVESFSVTPIDDNVVEADETFTIGIASVVPTTALASDISTTATATITIVNDDQTTLTITEQGTTETDSDFNQAITVTLSNPVQGGVSVTITSIDGTAVAGSDFSAVNVDVNFPLNSTANQSFNVNIIGDNLFEPTESFTLSAGVATVLTGVDSNDVNRVNGVVTIIDDDNPSLEVLDLTVDESVGTAVVVVQLVDSGIAETLTVNVSTSDNTATAATDYISITNQVITFDAGSEVNTTQAFNVTINDDALVEGTQTFIVTLANPSISAVTLTRETATVTIVDNDIAQLTIIDATESESAGQIVVNVTLDRGVQGGFTATLGTVAGTAVAGSDFIAFGATATVFFASNSITSDSVILTLVDDTTVEPLESLQINVANITTLTAPESAINRDTSTFTIINDDSATFTIADNNGVENASAISVSVTLNQPVQDGLTVTFNSVSGSAIDGSDYPTVSNVLFFDGNQGEVESFSVTPIDDNVVEADETFTIGIASVVPTTALASDISTTATATITIVNDDQTTLTITDQGTTETDSDFNQAITVTLSNPVQGGVSVTITSIDGTAVAGSDFSAVNADVNFPLNSTANQSFNVNIIGDNLFEPTESFTLSAGVATVLTGVDSNNVNRVNGVVTIIDDDNPSLEVLDLTVDESVGTAVVVVQLVDSGIGRDING